MTDEISAEDAGKTAGYHFADTFDRTPAALGPPKGTFPDIYIPELPFKWKPLTHFTARGTTPNSKGEYVGARIDSSTRCTECGRRPAKGDLMEITYSPDMIGSIRHWNCDNPTEGPHR